MRASTSSCSEEDAMIAFAPLAATALRRALAPGNGRASGRAVRNR